MVTNNVDLNRLRDIVRANQQTDEEKPADTDKKLWVTRDGKLAEGNQAQTNDRTLSEVPQDTFASRLESERAIVATKFPRNARELTTTEGVRGWVYSFVNEFGQEFTMFAYFDGNYYQVKVIDPVLEAEWQSPHTGHLWSDGRICFGSSYGSGRCNLADAYSKSVLWANGISVALHGGEFPFSINQ